MGCVQMYLMYDTTRVDKGSQLVAELLISELLFQMYLMSDTTRADSGPQLVAELLISE